MKKERRIKEEEAKTYSQAPQNHEVIKAKKRERQKAMTFVTQTQYKKTQPAQGKQPPMSENAELMMKYY